MDEKHFQILSRKMDSLLKILAYNVISGKAVNEQVDILTKVGLKAGEIAEILDKTENQVYVTQNALRNAKKKKTGSGSTDQSSQNGEVHQNG